MRTLTQSEYLLLRELIQMETAAIITARSADALIKDPRLKEVSVMGIKAGETRLQGLQRFVSDYGIIGEAEVH